MDEMRELVDKLNMYRNSYYNDNMSLISDKEYDFLFDRLLEMEEDTDIVYSNSPTVTVGYEVVSKLEKVKHNHPLLSLGKTTDINEFSDYFRGHEFCLMAKMDGLTASIKYSGGKLVSGESRGNGEIGEDITHNIRTFANLPTTIPFFGELIIDGECIIDYGTFEQINKNENTQYKNPRNLVSGTVRQLDSKIAANRHVRFIAWKLYSAKDVNGNILPCAKTYSAGFDFLKSLGFEVVPYFCGKHSFASNMECNGYFNMVMNNLKNKCDNMKYPLDGIVGAFDDVDYGNSLGSTGHHPKHSLAFKFYQERNETTLIDIKWSTSRTGMVNPVAIVEPVEIDGTTVCRATLSNVSIIKELELGIGDTLTIIKANQIIPQITDNLTRSNNYMLPTVCPDCGQPLMLKNDTGREMLFCTNNDCPGINHDRISNFTHREAMNIVGISDERLKTLMDRGFITDFASIYHLKDYRGEIAKIDGFGKASVDNLLKAIDNSINCKFSNVLVAIGIPGIGKSAAKTVSKHCSAIQSDKGIFRVFVDMACSDYDWTVLENFGDSMSAAINAYVQNNLNKIEPLISILNIAEDSEGSATNYKFDGKTFCITGKLLKYENRDRLVDDIEKYGGKVVSSVTSKTNYLITNEPDSGSSKNQKAAKFGTAIITEEQFIEMREG